MMESIDVKELLRSRDLKLIEETEHVKHIKESDHWIFRVDCKCSWFLGIYYYG